MAKWNEALRIESRSRLPFAIAQLCVGYEGVSCRRRSIITCDVPLADGSVPTEHRSRSTQQKERGQKQRRTFGEHLHRYGRPTGQP